MKSKQTTSRIRIEQLEYLSQVEEIDNVEAARINGGYRCKYSGPEFKAGDETMANEGVDIVYEDFMRAI